MVLASILWPLVVLAGLVLAYRVALTALSKSTRHEEWATAKAEEQDAALASQRTELLAAIARVEERVRTVDQRTDPTLGLRRTR